MAQPEEALGTGARFIKLLQSIAEADREFSLKDIAGRIGLPPSTTHRLLQLLARSDLVERTEGQGYRVGRELFRIASLVVDKYDVQRLARPVLQELWQEWRETAALCLYMPSTRTGMVVEMLKTPHPLQYVMEPFSHLSLVWGSLGRAILAHLPDEDVDAILGAAEPGPLSGRPTPSRARLREELQQIRRRGVAVYEDPTFLDIAGVAAPVFGHNGKILGSVGITMPAQRYEPLPKERLATDVALRARQLSAALGCKPR